MQPNTDRASKNIADIPFSTSRTLRDATRSRNRHDRDDELVKLIARVRARLLSEIVHGTSMNKDQSSSSSSASVPVPGPSEVPRKHDRSELKHLHNLRLPTPPPDPTLPTTPATDETFQKSPESGGQDAILKEIEFLEYLSSLSSGYQQKSDTKTPFARTNTAFAQVVATEDAFDHLDKLYKLMEQLLNLREQNSKLQRRVRDLEHFKMLQEMHARVEQDFNAERLMFQDLESDPAYAESLLDTMIAAGRNANSKRNLKFKGSGGPQSRFRQSILRKGRDRSSSVAVDDAASEEPYGHESYLRIPFRRESAGIAYGKTGAGKSSKVSKWTKVKAAFKWEKASPTVNGTVLPGAKSQDSGIGGMLPSNNEVARYLRVPSICHGSSSGGVSPADSVLSGQSSQGLAIGGNQNSVSPSVDLSVPATPGSLSSASSMEDIHTNEEQLGRSRDVTRSEKLLHQRLSTCSDEEDPRDQQRRSKSYDDDMILGKQDDDALYYRKNWKFHKTPWSKVKDIIQTRKDSLKKSRNRSSMKFDDNFNVHADGDQMEFPEVFDSVNTRQPPMLTVTIPQNAHRKISDSIGDRKAHERRSLRGDEPKPIKNKWRKSSAQDGGLPQEVVRRYQEIVAKETVGGKVEVSREDIISDPETSPQTPRRNSRWTFVKKAFLSKNDEEGADGAQKFDSPSAAMSMSQRVLPTCSEFATTKDDLSNPQAKRKLQQEYSYPQSNRKLQEEIRKNYEELQNKLSLEFQEKLQEWERMKSSSCSAQNQSNIGSGASSSTVLDSHAQQVPDTEFQKKIDEWERMKQTPKPTQPTTPLNLTSEENLSADFRKKLQEWERMKKQGTVNKDDYLSSSSTLHSSSTRKKITDWQFFKSSSGGGAPIRQLGPPDTKQLSDDFLKKLEEWKHMKATNTVPSYSTDEEDRYKGAKTPSPDFARKDSSAMKIPRTSTKKLTKTQEEKELQWLEKELQKIEREKQRLEREREKFLEREERLAKLRRSIGNGHQKKEVLVQTSTGFFRFQGISRKFTQRLYEWEKARGIGPEASTLMLLNPGYQPVSSEDGNRVRIHEDLPPPGIKLTRSKSVDSVANFTQTAGSSQITHHASSLSLNDMDDLEAQCLVDSRMSSEPEDMHEYGSDKEPEAMIVDVEDVVVETAAPLEPIGRIKDVTHTPVYKVTQQDFDTMCEMQKCIAPKIQENVSTESRFSMLEELVSLVQKISTEQDAYQKLVKGVEDLNASTVLQNKETEKLWKEQTHADAAKTKLVQQKRNKIRHEGVTILNSCMKHSMSQTTTIQKIIKLLKKFQTRIPPDSNPSDIEEKIQDLSNHLVTIAEQLYAVYGDRKMVAEGALKKLKAHECTDLVPVLHVVSNGADLPKLMEGKVMELKRLASYSSADDVSPPSPPVRSRKSNIATLEQQMGATKSDPESPRIVNVTVTPKFLRKPKDDVNIQSVPLHTYSEEVENKFVVNIYNADKAESPKNRSGSNGGAIKRKVKTRPRVEIKLKEDSCSDDDGSSDTKKKSRKLLRSKRVSESDGGSQTSEKDTTPHKTDGFNFCSNVLVSTSNFGEASDKTPESPVEIFVKTTRKLFTPIGDTIFLEQENKEVVEKEPEPVKIPEEKSEPAVPKRSPSESPATKRKVCFTELSTSKELPSPESEKSEQPLQKTPSFPASLPPLPHSPIPSRRDRVPFKETAPSIRLMIARYNQRLNEQEGGKSPGGSSGSASPVAWRSPVAERRVRAQTERYQEEIKRVLQQDGSKYSPRRLGREIMKSASAGFIRVDPTKSGIPNEDLSRRSSVENKNSNSAENKMLKGILKSSSAGSIKTDQKGPFQFLTNLKKMDDTCVNPPPEILTLNSPLSKMRALRIQKAKEEFLTRTTDPVVQPKPEPTNRLSQASYGSESSYDDVDGVLVKSASAGMINVDADTYQKLASSEQHTDGYVSLPRASKSAKDVPSGRFGIGSIASRFRKVKMRKHKDGGSSKMNTISMLCRQSLFVDLNAGGATAEASNQSATGSPVLQRQEGGASSSGVSSWIKKTRIFK